MTIYTVTSVDDLAREPLSHCVIGSYTTRGRALGECVKYVMDRLRLRNDLAWSMMNDENHPETGQFFVEHKDGTVGVRRGCVNLLKEFIRDELGGTGCYYVWDGENSWHFDVDENDLVGELWHTVTWGDGDCEGPEFTMPRPEAFTSEETAVKTFVDYVRDLSSGQGTGLNPDMESHIRTALARNGKYRLNLNNGRRVSCVLYHDDAKNIKE